MTNSAASTLTPAALRSYMETSLRPASLNRRLGIAAILVALFAVVYWYTRAESVLCELLVAIFAFHEIGHLLAARILNLTQRRGVWLRRDATAFEAGAAWREAAVALAGPLPGLVVSVALMIVSVRGGRIEVGEAAYALALFNGLNLLPFFPLDGGRFFHVLFFGRHPWTEVGFRVLAALGIASGAVIAGNPWLMLFAVLPMVHLRNAFTLGLLARLLRLKHPNGPVSDEAIGEALSRGFPKEQRPCVLARNAVTLRALVISRRPPTFAIFLLGFAYLLGIAGSVVVIYFPNLLG